MSSSPQLPLAQVARGRAARRAALWLLLLGVLVALTAGAVRAWTLPRPAPPVALPVTTQTEWGATATQFVRAYLSWSGSPEQWQEAVNRTYKGPEIQPPPIAAKSTVTEAQVIFITPVDAQHALVTVQATLEARQKTTSRVLVVPVIRTAPGRATVYQAPGIAAPLATPPKITEESGDDSVSSDDLTGITQTVDRFISAYLQGQDYSLALAAGASVAPQPAPLRVTAIEDPQPLDVPRAPGSVVVSCAVTAQDPDLGREISLRLLIEMRKADRWQVVRVIG